MESGTRPPQRDQDAADQGAQLALGGHLAEDHEHDVERTAGPSSRSTRLPGCRRSSTRPRLPATCLRPLEPRPASKTAALTTCRPDLAHLIIGAVSNSIVADDAISICIGLGCDPSEKARTSGNPCRSMRQSHCGDGGDCECLGSICTLRNRRRKSLGGQAQRRRSGKAEQQMSPHNKNEVPMMI